MPTDQTATVRTRVPAVGTTVHKLTDEGEVTGQPGMVVVAQLGSPIVDVRWHDGTKSSVSVLDLYWSAR